MKKEISDFETCLQRIVSDEIIRQLGTFTAVQALGEENKSEKKKESDPYMDIDELSKITGLAKQTIYGKRSRRELPGTFKFGRELRFKREEINSWLASKRLPTINERRSK